MPMMLAYGIALGLYNRERTGKGTRLETSLMNAALAMQHVDLVQTSRDRDSGGERAGADQAVFAPYLCADGQWILPVALSDKEWVRICHAMEIPHLAHDERYATAQSRSENSEDIYGLLHGLFETKTRQEWLDIYRDHDALAVPIMDRADVLSSEQVTANDMRLEFDHPTAGHVVSVNTPLRFPEQPPEFRRRPPLQGEHTDEVLRDLGYNEAELCRLRETGIVK